MAITAAQLDAIASQLGTLDEALEDEEGKVKTVVSGVRRRLRTVGDNWEGPRSLATLASIDTYIDELDLAPEAISAARAVVQQLKTYAAEFAGHLRPDEEEVAGFVASRASGAEIDPFVEDAAHRAQERISRLGDDWINACVTKTGALTGSIDQLTSCAAEFIDGLPQRVLTDGRHGELVLWFGRTYGVDVTAVEADPPDPPSEAWLKLEELYAMAYETPGLPDSVRQAYQDEYEFFSMLHAAALRGGYAEEQLQAAEDAYLAGAPRQYVDDLLWGLTGYTAFFGPPTEDEQHPLIEANYAVRQYVGQAIAEGREFGPGPPDYVVVEFSAGQFGMAVGGVFIVSSSGTVFSGPAVSAATPGIGANARAGYISPADQDYTGEEVDAFVQGFALSGSVTAPPLSAGVSFPLGPFQPFEPGRSATELGIGAYPGADVSLVYVRESGLSLPAWSTE